jgi:hypothetical protein
MADNLVRSTWRNLDSHEFRLLLGAHISGPGQYDDHSSNPDRLHLPVASEQCRIVLTYSGRNIVGVEPGDAFDATEWAQIVEEVETSILAGPTKIGRECSFSSYPVAGWWRGARSGVCILPAPDDAPRPSMEMAEHPFILEFPLQESGLWEITNHRRLREHRRLTLLLNVLLAGRTNVQPRRSDHIWAYVHNDDGGTEIQWVQPFYFAQLGEIVRDVPSPVTAAPLEQINADEYFTRVRGSDGQGLRVPSDLDESICQYLQLDSKRRADFDRAAYWLDTASRQRSTSLSASFAALVSVIESLINRRGSGSTRRFRDFLECHAPGASLEGRRTRMYELRSGILHGSELMAIDENVAFGWDPPSWNDRQLFDELSGLTRLAIRNWLRTSSS